jgi:hypothetical protein
MVSASAPSLKVNLRSNEGELTLAIIFLNTIFAVKELVSRLGQLDTYWRDIWNLFDVLSFVGVYLYVVDILFNFITGDGHVPLSVFPSIFLTLKLLSIFGAS